MHGLILAGGDGSRLLASGVTVPKALVEIGGQPQLGRMIAACQRAGCETITCAVRDDLVAAATEIATKAGATVVPVRTASSLHTLVTGLRSVAAGDVLCTLVDSVMPAKDWDAADAAARQALRTADAVVAVTPFVDDESPLWADVDATGLVHGFGTQGARPIVTGGVYWLTPRARQVAHEAVEHDVTRLRGFLKRLIALHRVVRAVEVRQIVDVDTSADLDVALALVGGEQA